MFNEEKALSQLELLSSLPYPFTGLARRTMLALWAGGYSESAALSLKEACIVFSKIALNDDLADIEFGIDSYLACFDK